MDRDRRLAFLILKEISSRGTWSNLAVKDALASEGAASPAFVRELVYGCLRNQKLLDHNIDRFLRSPKLKPAERIILRMGFYQMAFMDGVPDHAAVSETVSLAAAFMKGRQGFVNAVLRSFQRDGKRLLDDGPATRYSCAEWIAELWTKSCGAERAEEYMKASCRPAPFTVRANTAKISRDALAERLRALGLEAEGCALSARCLTVRGGGALDTQEYADGLFSVQGEASAYAVELLSPQPGESVLDLCAAPGGKTCAAAEMMDGKGRIAAFDVYSHRAELIKKEAHRLGHSIISIGTMDSSVFEPSLEGLWDRVIADVPCSGLGTLSGDPEIKLREMSPGEAEKYISDLAEKQGRILENAARYARPGGRILYSTCTVDPFENGLMTEKFISEHPGYSIEKQQQIFPSPEGREGFYICVIRRSDDKHRL
ncbi:MAG: 16S rRNA (cytosine(967)-C(5))-methyltransferase RsmB [Firmicutes bacterium]|nr:16S rRNA (cytosine(967)-C(5))-methyltransferase RsmB [Bacillota bacterium]